MKLLGQYQWTVIGAGPAGMAVVGKLIDRGVSPKEIAWIDPEFKVGDFGTRWRNVSSNTKVDLFIKFLENIHAFDYANYADRAKDYTLHQIDPNETCWLRDAANPLQWASDQLKTKVNSMTAMALKLKMLNRHWQITLEDKNTGLVSTIQSKNVVLALGSEPKTMPSPVPIIPLSEALDTEHLSGWVEPTDTVAVFGASHSAVIVIRLLLELGVKQVINFYRSPLRYAVYMENWILFDNTGLKGQTAKWAREHIDGNMPENLTRVWASEENIQAYLPLCHKAVQAIGFKPRSVTIEGMPVVEHNDKSGIIAPGLFGFGIAFPETTVDPFGNVETSVGLWKFLNYLNRVISVWEKYGVE